MPAINLVKEPAPSPIELVKKPSVRPRRRISIKEPSGGLVPLGDTGLWITPDEPADPQDCARYPTSAWCTYDFFTLTPFSFEPAIAIDACNIGARLDMSFGFYRLPPISLVYRDPSEECKLQLPQAPNDYNNGGFTPYPNNLCNENSQSLSVYWISYSKSTTYYEIPDIRAFIGYVPGEYYIESETRINVTNVEFPYTTTETPRLNRNGQIWNPLVDFIIGKVHYTATTETTMSQLYRDEVFRDDIPLTNTHTENIVFFVESSDRIVNMTGTGVTAFGNKAFYMLSSTVQAKEYLDTHPLTSGAFSSLIPEERALYNQNIGASDQFFVGNEYYYKYYTLINNWDIKVVCSSESYKKNPPPPREDNPPPRRCCMACCPSHGEQDNSLLALLLEKVDKLSNIVGVNDYPISVPASFISKDEGFLGNLIPNENIPIQSLTTFIAWYIERFDEIMGQWEIPIEIKDSDPTKSGEQPVGIKLPNIAECMAEMFTLCFQTNINSETLLNVCLRTLIETGTDKQQNFVSYKLLQSLTDWVGYKQKDTVQPMPLSFTLNKTRYDEILKESEVDVSVPEFDEKFGLEADLMRFREAASILQANHKIKVNPNGDIKAQILKYLLDSFSSVNKVNGEDTEQDFEDFLEEVETGFINTRGVTNNKDPYGKPFNERPRIRDLTNFSTDNPE